MIYSHNTDMMAYRKKDLSNPKQGVMGLATAILETAANDYIEALISYDYPQILSNERFFLSNWGQELSFGQGEVIIRYCRMIAKEQRDEMQQNE